MRKFVYCSPYLSLSKTNDRATISHQLVAELDPHNAGVLIVRMDGASGSEREVVGPGEITRKLERSEESCVIM